MLLSDRKLKYDLHSSITLLRIAATLRELTFIAWCWRCSSNAYRSSAICGRPFVSEGIFSPPRLRLAI